MHYFFFFFNDTATTEIYTLSLHDALPISPCPRTSPTVRGSVGRRPAAPRSDARRRTGPRQARDPGRAGRGRASQPLHELRSEEHTSELQSQSNLVCRLLLEKKKNKRN